MSTCYFFVCSVCAFYQGCSKVFWRSRVFVEIKGKQGPIEFTSQFPFPENISLTSGIVFSKIAQQIVEGIE